MESHRVLHRGIKVVSISQPPVALLIMWLTEAALQLLNSTKWRHREDGFLDQTPPTETALIRQLLEEFPNRPGNFSNASENIKSDLDPRWPAILTLDFSLEGSVTIRRVRWGETKETKVDVDDIRRSLQSLSLCYLGTTNCILRIVFVCMYVSMFICVFTHENTKIPIDDSTMLMLHSKKQHRDYPDVLGLSTLSYAVSH